MSSPTVSERQERVTLGEAESVIRLEGVSVRYRVPQERIPTLKEYAIRWLRRRVQYADVWALREVSFEAKQGEVFGIVGQNGAGKSTLLKLIARVLHPTSGRVWVKGKVAPLLELGAGFHYELTGRENVFLNGAMLGFSQQEMARKFDEIVDFAELRDFIDAPLRTYSTGMVARLGFAVATRVEPDILLIDELLAVGDERFQRKCLARMQEFRRRGATIVLVSHSTRTISAMCDRAIWLEQGQVLAYGDAEEVVTTYQSFLDPEGKVDRGQRYFHPGWGITRGELLRLLVLATGLPLVHPERPSFVDLPPEGRYYPYVETARVQGAVAGYGDGSFQPERMVTRAEATVMAVRLAGYPLVQPQKPAFVDVSANSWYASYVETAHARGLLHFADGERFEPLRELTRAEAAALGVRLGDYALLAPSTPTFADLPPEEWSYPYIETAWERDLFGGRK